MSAGVGATVLLAAIAAAPAAKKPEKPKPSGTSGKVVNITPSPLPARYGTFVTLFGRLSGGNHGGKAVRLQADPYPFAESGFRDRGTKVTAGSGEFTFAERARVNTRYRVVAFASPTIVSPTVTALVSYRVGLRVSDLTPRSGALVRFSGFVYPRKNGAAALIQRQAAGGAFVTVARAKLHASTSERSKYSRRLRVSSSGVYRVHVPGSARASGGDSVARTVTVT
ncbi:MAG TPA: hypothetical protein VFZ89_10960 [Solirubrobacteraceae bacterium]